jgi:pilus assembly protein CpaF
MTVLFTADGRQYSYAALIEKIETEFAYEVLRNRQAVFDTPDTRRDLIRDVTDYVLATESILVDRPDRMALLTTVYNNLFGFGPLHSYLTDETVSEISLDAPDRVSVRHGGGDLAPVAEHFEDAVAMERAITFVLSGSGATLDDSEPITEMGTTIEKRPVRIAVTMPTVGLGMQANLRLHPATPASLLGLFGDGVFDEPASRLLDAVLQSGHGLMIVGEPGSGKTTLIEALVNYLPTPGIVVERAVELRLPDMLTRMAAIPHGPKQAGVSFPEQLAAAMKKLPSALIVDEIRFDEAPAMWDALTDDHHPRLLWAFRGSHNPVRLKAAFSMSVRRARPGIDQELIYSALLARLPFVAITVRREGKLTLNTIGEWRATEPGNTKDVQFATLWPEGEASERAIGWTP